MKNPLIISPGKNKGFSTPENQSKGIFDDYAVRKDIQTRSLTTGQLNTGSLSGASLITAGKLLLTDASGNFTLNLPSLSAIRWGGGTVGTSRLLEQYNRLIYTCAGARMDFLNAAGNRYLCFFASGLFSFYDQSGTGDSNRYQYSDNTGSIYMNKTTGNLYFNTGNISGATYYQGGKFVSEVATGTSPYACTSTTLNTNLNADLWDGYQFSDYLNQAVKTTSEPIFHALEIGESSNMVINSDGKIEEYNNVATEGYGVPAIVDNVELLAQNQVKAATHFTNAGTAGMYRVSWYLYTSVADDNGTGTITLNILNNDGISSKSRSVGSTSLLAANYDEGVDYFYVASGNLQYETLMAGDFGSGEYSIRMSVERLN